MCVFICAFFSIETQPMYHRQIGFSLPGVAMDSIDAIQFITPMQLRMLQESQCTLIVDVRDTYDVVGGKIPQALHCASATFDPNVVRQMAHAKKATAVVFHCMKSQVRGPNAAQKYVRLLNEKSTQKVYVLEGGFEEYIRWCFSEKSGGNPHLDLVDYDQKYWGWKMPPQKICQEQDAASDLTC